MRAALGPAHRSVLAGDLGRQSGVELARRLARRECTAVHCHAHPCRHQHHPNAREGLGQLGAAHAHDPLEHRPAWQSTTAQLAPAGSLEADCSGGRLDRCPLTASEDELLPQVESSALERVGALGGVGEQRVGVCELAKALWAVVGDADPCQRASGHGHELKLHLGDVLVERVLEQLEHDERLATAGLQRCQPGAVDLEERLVVRHVNRRRSMASWPYFPKRRFANRSVCRAFVITSANEGLGFAGKINLA